MVRVCNGILTVLYCNNRIMTHIKTIMTNILDKMTSLGYYTYNKTSVSDESEKL